MNSDENKMRVIAAILKGMERQGCDQNDIDYKRDELTKLSRGEILDELFNQFPSLQENVYEELGINELDRFL